MQVIFDIHQKVEDATSGFRLSIENVLQQGLNLFRKEPGPFILYGIITALALSNPISGLLLGGPAAAGYYIVAQRIRQGKKIEISDFFRSLDKFVPLLILHLLISLLVVLGLMLLILPGIYLAISYLFAHFFVWFYDREPYQAIGLSRKVVSGNFGQILLLLLVLAGINLLGFMALGIGILLTMPYSFCVVYAAFDDIIGIKN